MINIHQSRCDALVLLHPSDPGIIHVPLAGFSYEHAERLQAQLWNVLKEKRLLSRFRDAEQEEETHRGIKPPNRKARETDPMQLILSELWTQVVKLVVDTIFPAVSTVLVTMFMMIPMAKTSVMLAHVQLQQQVTTYHLVPNWPSRISSVARCWDLLG